MSSADLIAAVQAELDEEGDLSAALTHNLDVLKAEYGCDIACQHDRDV
jgi:hypothetical protein